MVVVMHRGQLGPVWFRGHGSGELEVLVGERQRVICWIYTPHERELKVSSWAVGFPLSRLLVQEVHLMHRDWFHRLKHIGSGKCSVNSDFTWMFRAVCPTTLCQRNLHFFGGVALRGRWRTKGHSVHLLPPLDADPFTQGDAQHSSDTFLRNYQCHLPCPQWICPRTAVGEIDDPLHAMLAMVVLAPETSVSWNVRVSSCCWHSISGRHLVSTAAKDVSFQLHRPWGWVMEGYVSYPALKCRGF